jgi:rhodanese-related sulfurtransferase
VPTPISRDELARRLRLGARLTLVEALGYDWWADAHLPGAVNMPASRAGVLAFALLPDLDEPVVVYASRTSGEACHAAAVLEALGYRDVQVYAEGKEAWIEAGLPVERER